MRSTRELGAALRAAREAQQLTQAAVASSAGVSRRWLIAIEGGGHPRAELDGVLRVLRALNLDLQLLPSDPPVAAPPATTATTATTAFNLDEHLSTFRQGT